jgi:hypothetical protein
MQTFVTVVCSLRRTSVWTTGRAVPGPGQGIVIDGDGEIPVVAGDVVHTRRGQWHGFINTSDSEDAEMIWLSAGAASRDTAGYEARR